MFHFLSAGGVGVPLPSPQDCSSTPRQCTGVLPCSTGLSQLGTGHGSWTTLSRFLNETLGWIFSWTFMRGEWLAANLKFSVFFYND